MLLRRHHYGYGILMRLSFSLPLGCVHVATVSTTNFLSLQDKVSIYTPAETGIVYIL
jgi:hypothetical protein